MKNIIPVIIICFILGACSFHMEKRRYFKGYYISINHGHRAKPVPKIKEQNANHPASSISPPEFIASVQQGNASSKDSKVLMLKKHIPVSENDYLRNSSLVNTNKKQHNVNSKSGVGNYHHENSSRYKSVVTSSKTKNTKGSDRLFLLLSGAFIAAFTMAFKPCISHTKKIGYWALNNRKVARGLHFVAHCGLAGCGYYLGQRCYDAGLISSDVTTYSLASAATVIAALYPHRKTKTGFFKNTYFKQKMFSMLMVLTGLLMFVNIGNRKSAGNLSFPLVNKVCNLGTDTNPVIHTTIESIKADTPKNDHRGAKIGFTILTAFVSLILCVVIIGGSCSLSCSGQESLSIAVLFIGLPMVIILSVYIFKSIWKDEMEEKRRLKIKPPATI